MKREAMGHRKLKKLCFRLHIPTWGGVGLLESLWHMTGREAPAGDIGKMSDDDIAIGMDYSDDAQQLIEAFIYAGWIDRDSAHRLLVHDWPDHCEDLIHAKLARAGLRFANGRIPNFKKLSQREREVAEKIFGQQPTAADGGQKEETAASGSQIEETVADGGQRQPKAASGALPGLAQPSLALPCPAKPSQADRSVESTPGSEELPAPAPAPDRPIETRSGITPAGKILGPLPANGAIRHTRAAIAAEIHREPGDEIIGRIVQQAQQLDPEITDEEVAIWAHAVVPDTADRKPRGPAWFERVVTEFVRQRPRDVALLRAFLRGEIPRSEADRILTPDSRADGRVRKALRVWLSRGGTN